MMATLKIEKEKFITIWFMTQFEIECKSGKHSATFFVCDRFVNIGVKTNKTNKSKCLKIIQENRNDNLWNEFSPNNLRF